MRVGGGWGALCLQGLLVWAELGRGRSQGEPVHLGGCNITDSGSFFLQ